MRGPTLKCALAALLPSLLATTIGTAAVASAAPEGSVKLPVMPSRLDAGDPCTGASAKVASAAPWEQRNLELPRTWQFAGGAGEKVAVVDTGVSTTAPALAGAVTPVGGAAQDCVGHGTFVAGLIAAARVEGVHFAGVAQRARILAVRGTDQRGNATAGTVAAGIRAAVDAGASVIDVSPALTGNSAELRSAVSYAAGHDALVVAAAVPDPTRGTGASAPPPRAYWPAAQPGVLSVVDVDQNGGRPRGALTPLGADLAAPGVGVIGVGPTGKGHFIGSGASLAAAYVAGTAALVRSAYPRLTAAETARRLTTAAYPAPVPRLDPYASVTSVGDSAAHHSAGAARHAAPVSLPSSAAGDRATRRALLLAALGAAVVLLVGWASVIVPRGRARGWRPARD
ncbi:type VII secretion-associated serine protease [Streptomyces sulfonofaciens]|uniref:Type VII secretion-associated serine protease n=1 Tax=Streptomyces sulfonofaciens TaxID=68272 RepID=A0A919GA85_9ACTN|nr:S8 family serine peptidase [Streptomyces sulfonofaciens]GHH80296.1 type VII secretion-associated serine protease [Streptomyces sulfonofaciens]